MNSARRVSEINQLALMPSAGELNSRKEQKCFEFISGE